MAGELNSKCRTCLSESNTYHQLHDYVGEYEVMKMLDGIVPQIEIKNSSKFSTLMCQSCVDKLLISYKFQQLCIESNNRLHDSLSSALFEPDSGKLLKPLAGESILQLKQENEDASECELAPNELESGIRSDDDNRVLDDDGGIDSDSSNEQLSVLKERLVKEIPVKIENVENFNQLEQQHTSVHRTMCTICDKDFLYNSKLKEHMRKHSGECPYLCTQCGKRFRRSRGLQYHISMHNGEKPYACSQCGKSFRGKSHFREHMLRHSGLRKFQCPDCPSRFYRRSDLKRHCRSEKVHLNITNYGRPSKLQNNEEVKSTDRFQENTNEAREGVSKIIPKKKIAESMDDDAEWISNDQEESDDNSENVMLPKLGARVKESKRKQDGHYPCETCGKVFSKVFRLKRHSSVHSMTRPHKCEICKYRFSSIKTLKGHLSKHKNGTVHIKQYMRHKDKIKPVCSICGKEFANNYNLKEHMRLHSGEKPYQCAQCGKTFRYSSALKEHMRTHSGEHPYECSQCGQTFRFSSSFNRHKDKHMGLKKYRCPECPSRFKYTSDLADHRTKLHSSVGSLKKEHENKDDYTCEICNSSLTSEKSLEDHMLTHTNDEFATKKIALQNDSIGENDCNEIFEIQEFLEVHRVNDEGEEEYFEKKALLSAQYKVHQKNDMVKITEYKHFESGMQDNEVVNSTDEFQEKTNETMDVVVKEEIEDTSQIFDVSMDNYNNHEKWITNDYEDSHIYKESIDDDEKWINNDYEYSGDNSEKELFPKVEAKGTKNVDCADTSIDVVEKPESSNNRKGSYPCETCGKIFCYPYLLNRHGSVHSLTRPHECEICKYRFATTNMLETHLLQHKNKRIYSNSQSPPEIFKCPDCPRRFERQASLTMHSLIHSRNTSCMVCQRNFISIKTLAEHVSNTHPEVEKHKCDQCDKTFVLYTQLLAHLNRHKDNQNVVCLICEKEFGYSYMLKEHMRSHNGENPYACTKCDKTFRKSDSLRQHMERHTGLRKYQCSQCPSRFKCRSDLTSHKRKIHLRTALCTCTQCGKNFSSAGNLREHMEKHKGLRKYQCPKCPKRFNCRSDLIHHERITKLHPKSLNVENDNGQGDNFEYKNSKNLLPFQCPDCPKCFKEEASLSLHYKMHTKTLKSKKLEPGMEGVENVNLLDKLQEHTCESTIKIPTITVKEEILPYEEAMEKFDGTEWFNNDYKKLDDNSEANLRPKLESKETTNIDFVDAGGIGE